MRRWPPATSYPATARRYLLVQLRSRSSAVQRARGCRPAVYQLLLYSVRP